MGICEIWKLFLSIRIACKVKDFHYNQRAKYQYLTMNLLFTAGQTVICFVAITLTIFPITLGKGIANGEISTGR